MFAKNYYLSKIFVDQPYLSLYDYQLFFGVHKRESFARKEMKPITPRIDLPRIIAQAEGFAQSLINRGDPLGREKVHELLKLAETRKGALKQLDELNSRRNKKEVIDRKQLSDAKAAADAAEKDFYARCLSMPNWTHSDVPIGDESKARITATNAGVPEAYGKSHTKLCELHDLADFQAASKTTGTKFVFLKREAALLEMALQRFAINHAMKTRRFVPISTPDLVKPWIIEACGFQPRGEATQIYHVSGHDLCLVGTSEITLAGYLAGSKLKEEQRLLGISHCFRTEAGATGKDSKGLYRLHQFSKTEMFVACHPAKSETIHEDLVKVSTEICDLLGLKWRVLDMPTQELGASAYRKYDVEVYMPGSRKWGEVASITNTTDFQSRRLDIKFEGEFAHTLNGTACAVPRLLLAILETHQNSDSSISIPKHLADICGFDVIRRPS